MAQMTIASVWFSDEYKTGNVSFTADPEKKIKVWKDAPFKDALKVGASAEAKFKTEPAKGTFPEQKFLVSWDGVGMPDKPKGGGGGGFRLTPEQFITEKKSILASVALKEARESIPGSDAETIIAIGKKFNDALRSWAGIV